MYFQAELALNYSNDIQSILGIAVNSLRTAKDKSKNTSTEVNKSIREVSYDVDELISNLEQNTDISEDFFQALMSDIQKVKGEAPTTNFKNQIAEIYSVAQKARDVFKFRTMSYNLLDAAEDSFQKYIPTTVKETSSHGRTSSKSDFSKSLQNSSKDEPEEKLQEIGCEML